MTDEKRAKLNVYIHYLDEVPTEEDEVIVAKLVGTMNPSEAQCLYQMMLNTPILDWNGADLQVLESQFYISPSDVDFELDFNIGVSSET